LINIIISARKIKEKDMDFFEIVEKRYSHKERFLPAAVPLKDLELIGKAGLAAPTGTNSQCVRLIILPDRASLQPLCDVVPTEGLLTAPAAIAVLTDRYAQNGPYNFEVEDYSASAAQMLLAVTALGYVSLWLDSPYFDEAKQKEALAVLGAPEGYHLRVVLPIGLPDGAGTRRNKMAFEERVSYGRFGGRL
jgi:nitroreductase